MTRTRPSIAAILSVTATAFLLGGCQMLGIGGNRVDSASVDRALPVDFGAAQLAEGRAALTAGRTADAIDSFMLAKAFPEHAPAALNGLAVAYSRIGRPDLTERFFQAAVALAPQDDRFRANLALFYIRNGVPRAAEPVLAMAPLQTETVAPVIREVAVAAAPRVRALGAGLTVERPGASVRRISAGEVTIGHPAPTPASAAPVRRAVIEVGGSRPQAYPVRVTLAPTITTSSPRRTEYPIRIPLDD